MAGRILEVRFAPKAERAFLSLPARDQRRLAPHIDALARDPRPRGAQKLAGEEGVHRIRVGSWWVLYVVRDWELVVLVLDLGRRKDVVRGL